MRLSEVIFRKDEVSLLCHVVILCRKWELGQQQQVRCTNRVWTRCVQRFREMSYIRPSRSPSRRSSMGQRKYFAEIERSRWKTAHKLEQWTLLTCCLDICNHVGLEVRYFPPRWRQHACRGPAGDVQVRSAVARRHLIWRTSITLLLNFWLVWNVLPRVKAHF